MELSLCRKNRACMPQPARIMTTRPKRGGRADMMKLCAVKIAWNYSAYSQLLVCTKTRCGLLNICYYYFLQRAFCGMFKASYGGSVDTLRSCARRNYSDKNCVYLGI